MKFNFNGDINGRDMQFGNGNTQNNTNKTINKIIIDGIEETKKVIEDSNATEEEKNEAKQILKSLIDHPIVAAVLGGLASSL